MKIRAFFLIMTSLMFVSALASPERPSSEFPSNRFDGQFKITSYSGFYEDYIGYPEDLVSTDVKDICGTDLVVRGNDDFGTVVMYDLNNKPLDFRFMPYFGISVMLNDINQLEANNSLPSNLFSYHIIRMTQGLPFRGDIHRSNKNGISWFIEIVGHDRIWEQYLKLEKSDDGKTRTVSVKITRRTFSQPIIYDRRADLKCVFTAE